MTYEERQIAKRQKIEKLQSEILKADTRNLILVKKNTNGNLNLHVDFEDGRSGQKIDFTTPDDSGYGSDRIMMQFSCSYNNYSRRKYANAEKLVNLIYEIFDHVQEKEKSKNLNKKFSKKAKQELEDRYPYASSIETYIATRDFVGGFRVLINGTMIVYKFKIDYEKQDYELNLGKVHLSKEHSKTFIRDFL